MLYNRKNNTLKIIAMKKNIGTIDKAIRIVIALTMIILAIAKVITGPLAIVFLVLSGVLILTSLVSFCPLYMPCGVNTSKKKHQG